MTAKRKRDGRKTSEVFKTSEVSKTAEVSASDIQPAPYELPVGWTWTTLVRLGAKQKNAIVDGPFGSNLKVEDYIEDRSSVPVLTTKNLNGDYSPESVRYISQTKFEELKRSEVKGGDIIVAKIGSCGKTGIYPQNMRSAIIPANLLKMTVDTTIDRDYVFYYLNSATFQDQLKVIISATAQPAFSVSKFKGLLAPLPPLPEQRRIVAKIEQLFAESRTARDALERVPALLKRFRQSVLAAAFRGQLTERDPNDEPASALLERIQRLPKSSRLRKSETRKSETRKFGTRKSSEEQPAPPPPDTSALPELPEGWTWTTVRQIAKSIQYGYTATSSHDIDGPQYLRITDIQSGKVDWPSVPRCEIAKGDVQKYLLKPGDIVFARSGATAGKSYLIKECPESVFASYLIRVQTSPEVLPDYLYAFFNSKDYWDNLTTRGNAQPNANAQVLGNVSFPLAPLPEQLRIVARIEALFAQADAVERAVAIARQRADKVDQAILSRAFRGEL